VFRAVPCRNNCPSDGARNAWRYAAKALSTSVYDYDVTFLGISPFAQIELVPVTRIRLSAGLRLDNLSYDYDDRLTTAPTTRHRRPADGSPSFTHLSPKLGVTWQVTALRRLAGSPRRARCD
jgi:iron complex outermembrane recepter protein